MILQKARETATTAEQRFDSASIPRLPNKIANEHTVFTLALAFFSRSWLYGSSFAANPDDVPFVLPRRKQYVMVCERNATSGYDKQIFFTVVFSRRF